MSFKTKTRKDQDHRNILVFYPKAFCTFFFLFFISSCSLFDKAPDSPDLLIKKASQQRVFFASYDLVWRAAHTVIRYPIAAENQDTGVLETDYIKSTEGWIAPHEKKVPSAGQRYKIYMIFAKGKIGGRESTRITIEKKIENQKDFFSDSEQVPSDGLEEKNIFYRIERELIIAEALKKAASQN